MAVNSATPADSKFKFEWLVNSTKVYTSNGVFLESPIFWSGVNHDLTWQMKLGASDECTNESMALYVRLIGSKNDAEVRCKLRFSIVHCSAGALCTFMRGARITKFVPGTSADTIRFDDIVLLSYKACLSDISKSRLTIVCEMEEIKNTDGEKDAVPFAIPACPISDNLRSLFDSKKFTDVELTISGQAFRAHKFVLVIHSPVFSAMFEHETVEKICNVVEIMDVTPAVFDEMLRFMYTGEVTDIEMIADGLLIAADKYAVERLKVMCEEALYKKVVVENAADTLILADTHNADQLKSRVLKFIVSRAKDVIAMKGFQSMVQSHPHLVAEILYKVVGIQK